MLQIGRLRAGRLLPTARGWSWARAQALSCSKKKQRARARGATIHARLSGYGTDTHGIHMTKPDPGGRAAAMWSVLAGAGLQATQIGHLNAHGTTTLAGDIIETQAIKEVFGQHAKTLAISSTKSMYGHLMGATGAVQFIASLLALRHGFAPPTIKPHRPDPECDLDCVPNGTRVDVHFEHVMSHCFAFGGSNAVLVASSASA